MEDKVTPNDIKKVLYKEKPIAFKQHRNELYDVMHPELEVIDTYLAKSSLGRHYFEIPKKEQGVNGFESREPAQQLIRWLDRTLFYVQKPCICSCHSTPGMLHIVPCCNNGMVTVVE